MSYTTNGHAAAVDLKQAQKEATLNEAAQVNDSLAAGYTTRSVAGNSNITLDADEARARVIELTGALTGSINVDLPSIATVGSARAVIVYNHTTGAFTVTFRYNGGTGVVIPQGSRLPVYHDGTNVYAVDDNPPRTWTAPTLLNSWVDYDTSAYFGAAYSRSGYGVRLRGAVKSGTATPGTAIFTLPVGYRPTKRRMFPASSVNAGAATVVARVGVETNGDVTIYAGDNTFLSLDGINFEAS